MIYRVVMDGNDILDYGDRDLSLIDPHLELEINAAGSLEFVMPPNHKYYDAVRIRKSTIEVYEDDTMIWFGRPIDQKIDFFKQKKIYCEGPLSFFNDSIMRPLEMENITLHGFFSTAVYSHNGQVDDNRMFTVGNITIPDSTVYRKFDYETTYDVLQKMCIETNDGYLFFRRQNNVNYIDWLKDMPFSCNQTIRFGINLLNYSSNFDTSDFATCVLPVGKADSETGEALTIASINGGSDIIVSEAAQTYGKVTQVVRLSDIEDQYELMSEGQKYLENSQFNALNIECSAADLHSMNPELELFRVGQNVHCVSEPHLVDRDFPLSKMQINLDSAAKLITLGIIKRRTLTRIYKQESESTTPYSPEQYQPEQYDPGVIEDENGDEWEIKMPEENGDPVTAVRMPIKITIAKPPNKTEYAPGETIDYTGISVNIWTKNKGDQEVIWTNPPKYLDGKAPFAELSFSMKTAPSQEGTEGFSVIVTWTYKGKGYSTTLELRMTNGGSLSPNVNAAGVEICHLEGGQYDRHFTTKTATPAKAGCWFKPTGSPIYSYIIVSRDADGCKIHCQDVRSPSFTVDLGVSGTIEIEGVTYYYGANYGLYTSYGGHAVSHIGPMIQAQSASEAARKLLTGG